jgi:hypothetical protein
MKRQFYGDFKPITAEHGVSQRTGAGKLDAADGTVI